MALCDRTTYIHHERSALRDLHALIRVLTDVGMRYSTAKCAWSPYSARQSLLAV